MNGSACGTAYSLIRRHELVSCWCSSASSGSSSSSRGAVVEWVCSTEEETSACPCGAYAGAATDMTTVLATGPPSASTMRRLRCPGRTGAAW